MEVQIAAAKVAKYATSESGDTLEIIERANGGLSLVLADGQRSGRAAKTISNLVARKAISLLAEGARDGVAARATHDYLFAARKGKVRADLQIISLDLITQTIIVSRNTDCPVAICRPGEPLTWIDASSEPIGLYPGTKPTITELSIVPQFLLVSFTDGLLHAGSRHAEKSRVPPFVTSAIESFSSGSQAPTDVQPLTDRLLAEAMRLEQGRPADDISVVALYVCPRPAGDAARRMAVRFPLSL